jgi:hypothetical protein
VLIATWAKDVFDGHWLTIVANWASVLGIAGLIAAFLQVLRTKKAVVAAQEAIERTENHLALNQVLVLLPQIQKLEDDLDAAVNGGSREAVLRHLGQWRMLAMEAYGLIHQQDYADDAHAEQLRQSAISAAAAKSQLVGTQKDLVAATRSVRREIATASEYAGTLSGSLKTYSRTRHE